MTMETAKVGGLACSAGLLLCWSSQITMECRNHSPRWPWCQPSWWGSFVFIMSTLRKSWIVCVMVAMMVFWAKGFWSQTAGMSELPSKSFSTSSPLPHCLHNKLVILPFNKNDQQKKAQKVLQVVAQRRSVVFTSFTQLRSYKELSEPWRGTRLWLNMHRTVNELLLFLTIQHILSFQLGLHK